MTALTVDPEDSESTILGKTVGDLQDDITITETRISGTLKYVDDFDDYSEDAELQSGHYLALKFTADENSLTSVQVIGGTTTEEPVVVGEGMNAVVRITDPMRQRLKVTSELDGCEPNEKIYRLTGLVLAEPEE